jgi:(S)-2-hydroxyglutarate dehydrogenase
MDADVTVIGAGIVGLATARSLQRRLSAQVVVVDKEPAPARHQTGRNSGVVHSGLYYRPGSEKARLVARGRRLYAELAREWGIPFEQCGKLIVATRPSELAGLAELERRAAANGVEVERLAPAEFSRIEPNVEGLAALHVGSAAITDFAAAARALAEEVAAGGGALELGAALMAIRPSRERSGAAGLEVVTSTATISTSWLVNCAGLHSDRVARLAGCTAEVRILPFRGEYHELAPGARGLVKGLVYPVPDPRWPFLGVHLTRMVDQRVHVGPNAVLALGREAYDRGVHLSEVADLFRTPGLRTLGRRYWRTGARELLRSRSRRLMLADVRRLVPDIGPADLLRSPAGIRAQAISPDGTLVDDFAFATSHRAVHVLNAPSPAATASLAIAEVITERLCRLMEN